MEDGEWRIDVGTRGIGRDLGFVLRPLCPPCLFAHEAGQSLNPPDWNSGSWVMHAATGRVSSRRSRPGRSTALGSRWMDIEPTAKANSFRLEMTFKGSCVNLQRSAAAQPSRVNRLAAISNVSANLVIIACFARLVFCRPPLECARLC